MGVVEEALHCSFLDGSVHPFDLSVGPGMVRLGEAVFDSVEVAGPIKRVTAKTCGRSLPVLRQIGELYAVLGEHGLDAVRNGFHERFEEGCGSLHIGLFHEFDHSELRGPVDGHEQVELALGGSHLGQVDVKEADRIAIELLPSRLVALDVGQTSDAVTLQTPVK
jgi:hypothetical protein